MMQLLSDELQKAGTGRILLGNKPGSFIFPDEGAEIYLTPVERTLYLLYLSHPEGISTDNLVLYWKELCAIYEKESRYDEQSIREDKMEALCAETKTTFYVTVARIKKKLIKAIGPWRADYYAIVRDENGVYKLRAKLCDKAECLAP